MVASRADDTQRCPSGLPPNHGRVETRFAEINLLVTKTQPWIQSPAPAKLSTWWGFMLLEERLLKRMVGSCPPLLLFVQIFPGPGLPRPLMPAGLPLIAVPGAFNAGPYSGLEGVSFLQQLVHTL